jgi:hypothetical protein
MQPETKSRIKKGIYTLAVILTTAAIFKPLWTNWLGKKGTETQTLRWEMAPLELGTQNKVATPEVIQLGKKPEIQTLQPGKTQTHGETNITLSKPTNEVEVDIKPKRTPQIQTWTPPTKKSPEAAPIRTPPAMGTWQAPARPEQTEDTPKPFQPEVISLPSKTPRATPPPKPATKTWQPPTQSKQDKKSHGQIQRIPLPTRPPQKPQTKPKITQTWETQPKTKQEQNLLEALTPKTITLPGEKPLGAPVQNPEAETWKPQIKDKTREGKITAIKIPGRPPENPVISGEWKPPERPKQAKGVPKHPILKALNLTMEVPTQPEAQRPEAPTWQPKPRSKKPATAKTTVTLLTPPEAQGEQKPERPNAQAIKLPTKSPKQPQGNEKPITLPAKQSEPTVVTYPPQETKILPGKPTPTKGAQSPWFKN